MNSNDISTQQPQTVPAQEPIIQEDTKAPSLEEISMMAIKEQLKNELLSELKIKNQQPEQNLLLQMAQKQEQLNAMLNKMQEKENQQAINEVLNSWKRVSPHSDGSDIINAIKSAPNGEVLSKDLSYVQWFISEKIKDKELTTVLSSGEYAKQLEVKAKKANLDTIKTLSKEESLKLAKAVVDAHNKKVGFGK